MISVYLVAVITFILTFYWWGQKGRPKNFPPGPGGIPVFGNAIQLGVESYKVAMDLRKTYGDIIGFKMGSHWLVYLNNPEDIREAFNMQEFSGRYGFNFMMDCDIEDANYGVIFSYGEKWHHYRRSTLKTLRDFGFAKRTSENIILEEVKEVVVDLKSRAGRPFSTHTIFNVPVFNVIWSILSGQRYDYEDPTIQKLVKLLDGFFATLNSGIRPFFFLFPWLSRLYKRFPMFLFRDGDKFRTQLFEFLRVAVEQHRETFQPGQPRDFMDVLVEEEASSPDFNEMDTLVTLMDFFIGGMESVSSALTWAFFLLAQHPEVQEKLVTEIQSIAGNRVVTLADRPNLKYVDATIQEIFRVATLGPFGTIHSTTKDVTYKGHFLPKNTSVVANIYASHFSEDIWTEPKAFRPERFLSADGTSVVRNKAWMPFGVGKRSCLGESLAKDEFFLFFTNIVQNIKISSPADEPAHSLEGYLHGGVRAPEHHRVVVSSRS